MGSVIAHPVVHLELRTVNLARACAFYAESFGWRAETVRVGRSSYLALALGNGVSGGVVEHAEGRATWLPYVEVPHIATAIERGCALGATVLLGPHEGPAGWRAVLAAPAGAEIALWQPKA